MKEVSFGPDPLGKIPIEKAFDTMFGYDTLRRVHGPSVKVSEWVDGWRKVEFGVNVDHVPKEVRRFFCGDCLRVTAKQKHTYTENKVTIENKIKMHFLGAELFRLNPVFCIDVGKDGMCYASGRVQHCAMVPPPFNTISEHFMAKHTERELQHYRDVVKGHLHSVK